MGSTQTICDDCWKTLPAEFRPHRYLKNVMDSGNWDAHHVMLDKAIGWLKENRMIPRDKPKRIPWGFKEESENE